MPRVSRMTPRGFCLEKLHLYLASGLGIMSVGMSSDWIGDYTIRLLAGEIV